MPCTADTPGALRRLALAVLLTLLAVAPTHGAPRSPEDQIALLRLDLRARKAEIVLEAMELTVDEAATFMDIYIDYDRKLGAINADRIQAIREFTANYATIDDARARKLLRLAIDTTRRRLDLLEKTAARIDRALSPRLALRFAQIENQLLRMIDMQLDNELPLIPRDALLPPPDAGRE
ncbi:MAG: hypothetical protein D6781_02130 [Verrucomicrobia bacterium]|nr:MAG: hypothetical protein D6781_02130 [Verrucomicrobiota bacterium]